MVSHRRHDACIFMMHLYSVSVQVCGVLQSREEGVALAVQLAECKERTRQAEDAADDAHNAAQASREQLEEAQAELQQMQQKVVETVANCRRYGFTV